MMTRHFKILFLVLIVITLNASRALSGTNDAAQFTRSNSEYLSITDASQTGLSPGDSDFHITFWAYFDSDENLCMVTKGRTAGPEDAEYYLCRQANDDLIDWNVSSNCIDSGNARVSSSSTTTTGTWYFVDVYHDSVNNEIGIAINNGAHATTAQTGGVCDNTQEFIIGGLANGNYMNGRIDQVTFYQEVLSSQDRTDIYNSGNGICYDDYPTGNLLSHWELSEASGTRADSETATGNDLTDNNTVTQAAGVTSCTTGRRRVVSFIT